MLSIMDEQQQQQQKSAKGVVHVSQLVIASGQQQATKPEVQRMMMLHQQQQQIEHQDGEEQQQREEQQHQMEEEVPQLQQQQQSQPPPHQKNPPQQQQQQKQPTATKQQNRNNNNNGRHSFVAVNDGNTYASAVKRRQHGKGGNPSAAPSNANKLSGPIREVDDDDRSGWTHMLPKSLRNRLPKWNDDKKHIAVDEPEELRAVNTCLVMIASKMPKKQSFKDKMLDFVTYPMRSAATAAKHGQQGAEGKNAGKWQPPVNAVELELPCPKSFRELSCPEEEDYRWGCHHCGEMLYCIKNRESPGITHFICGCGETPVREFRFRCKNAILHGHAFVPFKPDELRTCLQRFANFSHYNILLLGSSGVGKSTFINAFANYITYDTLDEAIKNPICAIPSRFTTFDNDDQLKDICVGDMDDKVAVHDWGKASTQYTKAHLFPCKGGRIRLIDPPGIGDPRGTEKDNENIGNIMSYVSELKELHAICILLKPNEARLSIWFEYCVNELLSHLYRNATKNIIFCFTNVGSTSGKPGESYITLQTLLRECEAKGGVTINMNLKTNVFCMENDPFRFLWEVNNGIQKNEMEFEDARRHWQNSARELRRLLEHVTKLEPQPVIEFIGLHQARRSINAISRPLAEIVRNIECNVKAFDFQMDELQAMEAEMTQHQLALFFEQLEISATVLPQPVTVCGDSECTEQVQDRLGAYTTHYKTKCHNPCLLEDVQLNTIDHQNLARCWAFQGANTCMICGCERFKHLHINYVQEVKLVKVINEEKQRQIVCIEDKKTAKELIIADIRQNIAEHEAEKKCICMTAAKLTAYLRAQASLPWNDTVKQYLENFIKEERERGNMEMCAKLEESLRDYLAVSALFNDTAASSGAEANTTIVETKEIPGLLQELFMLPHNGAQIERLYNAAMQGEMQYQNMLEEEKERQYQRAITLAPSCNPKDSEAYRRNSILSRSSSSNGHVSVVCAPPQDVVEEEEDDIKCNVGTAGGGNGLFSVFLNVFLLVAFSVCVMAFLASAIASRSSSAAADSDDV